MSEKLLSVSVVIVVAAVAVAAPASADAAGPQAPAVVQSYTGCLNPGLERPRPGRGRRHSRESALSPRHERSSLLGRRPDVAHGRNGPDGRRRERRRFDRARAELPAAADMHHEPKPVLDRDRMGLLVFDAPGCVRQPRRPSPSAGNDQPELQPRALDQAERRPGGVRRRDGGHRAELLGRLRPESDRDDLQRRSRAAAAPRDRRLCHWISDPGRPRRRNGRLRIGLRRRRRRVEHHGQRRHELDELIGTTDNQPLNLKVNGQRALRLEPNSESPILVGGHALNAVDPSASGATIAGGGSSSAPNSVAGDFATIGGGHGNLALGSSGTIAGGLDNQTGAGWSAVGGGASNFATADGAAVSGGEQNEATGPGAFIGGGHSNRAEGQRAVVPGGSFNEATGTGVRRRRRPCGPLWFLRLERWRPRIRTRPECSNSSSGPQAAYTSSTASCSATAASLGATSTRRQHRGLQVTALWRMRTRSRSPRCRAARAQKPRLGRPGGALHVACNRHRWQPSDQLLRRYERRPEGRALHRSHLRESRQDVQHCRLGQQCRLRNLARDRNRRQPSDQLSDVTNANLKVARCNDPACMGSNETLSTVDSPVSSVLSVLSRSAPTATRWSATTTS